MNEDLTRNASDDWDAIAGMTDAELQGLLSQAGASSPDEEAQGTFTSILVTIGYHC
jgi:hypothetical protein